MELSKKEVTTSCSRQIPKRRSQLWVSAMFLDVEERELEKEKKKKDVLGAGGGDGAWELT